MLPRLEPRGQPSALMIYASPLVAVVATLLTAIVRPFLSRRGCAWDRSLFFGGTSRKQRQHGLECCCRMGVVWLRSTQ